MLNALTGLKKRPLALAAAFAVALAPVALVPAQNASAHTVEAPIISTDKTVWSYDESNTDPSPKEPLAWTKPGFAVPDTWKKAKGIFGSKKGSLDIPKVDKATTLLKLYADGKAEPDVKTYHFRTNVNLAEAPTGDLTADVVYDDAIAIYVNGEYVTGLRDGAVKEAPAKDRNLMYSVEGGGDPETGTFKIPAAKLHKGDNTIAVALYQKDAGSSDIYFNFKSLTAPAVHHDAPVPVTAKTEAKKPSLTSDKAEYTLDNSLELSMKDFTPNSKVSFRYVKPNVSTPYEIPVDANGAFKSTAPKGSFAPGDYELEAIDTSGAKATLKFKVIDNKPAVAIAANDTIKAQTPKANSKAPSDLVMTIGGTQADRSFAWYTDVDIPQKIQWALASEPAGADGFPKNHSELNAASEGVTSSNQYNHKIEVKNLKAASEYVYRVGDEGNWSAPKKFSTPASFGGDYNFLFFGDPQVGASRNLPHDREGWIDTVNVGMKKFPKSELLFSAGDQVQTASNEEEYDAFLAPEQMRSVPLVPVDGNHDVGSKAYNQHFTVPNFDPEAGKAKSSTTSGGDYWFIYKDTLYAVIDSNSRDYASHNKFLEKVVAEQGAKVKWKILAFHHSIYSVAAHVNDGDIKERRDAMPTEISKLGFDMVLMGHDHSYTRTYLIKDGKKGNPAEQKAASDVTAKPGEVLYVTANSASGSKYYDVSQPDAWYASVINQEKVRNYSNVEVKDCTITVTTYRSEKHGADEVNSVVDKVTLHKDTGACAPKADKKPDNATKTPIAQAPNGDAKDNGKGKTPADTNPAPKDNGKDKTPADTNPAPKDNTKDKTPADTNPAPKDNAKNNAPKSDTKANDNGGSKNVPVPDAAPKTDVKNAAPGDAKASAPAATAPVIKADKPEYKVGAEVKFTLQGFTPGDKVIVELHSDPIKVAEVVANAKGEASGSFVLPAGLTGEHTLIGTDQHKITSSVKLLISAQGDANANKANPNTNKNQQSSGSNAGTLAKTGSEASVLVLVALAFIASGVLVVRARRKH